MPAFAWRRRLARYAALSPEEESALEQYVAASRHFATHDDLVKAGEPCDRLFVVLEGYACRYRLLPDGRRQIVAYLFAGDMSDPRELLAGRSNFSLGVLWPSVIAAIDGEALRRLEKFPRVPQAFARCAHTAQLTAGEWIVNVGQRTALERLGHLFCEIDTRLGDVGLSHDHCFDFPLTQAELGDTLALSAVHVNRTLMELRRLELVTFQKHQVRIHDFARLSATAGFDPAYLHRGEQF